MSRKHAMGARDQIPDLDTIRELGPGRLYLNPGGLHFSRGPLVIETLLGSCVAVTVRHRNRTIGGMCHYLLPQCPPTRPSAHSARYADVAFSELSRAMRETGLPVAEWECKVFGGARVIDFQSADRSIGEANITSAFAWARRIGIALTAHDVGGERFRYLRFDLSSGLVQVRLGPPEPPLPMKRRQERSGG